MGDYWYGSEQPLPSAALVALLNEFSISTSSGRVAVSRLSRRGVLVPSKRGRRTYYRLAHDIVAGADMSRPELLAFGSPHHGREWDGTWVLISFSVPADKAHVRRRLRAQLRGLGFGALQDGVWISASTKAREATRLLKGLPEVEALVVRGDILHPLASGALDTLAAWPLDTIRQLYDDFIGRFTRVLELGSQGLLSSAEALRERTELMDQWRGLFRKDPNLPEELLPADWPRARAWRLFADAYDTLGPLAELRCRQVVETHGPTPTPRHYTIAGVLGLDSY